MLKRRLKQLSQFSQVPVARGWLSRDSKDEGLHKSPCFFICFVGPLNLFTSRLLLIQEQSSIFSNSLHLRFLEFYSALSSEHASFRSISLGFNTPGVILSRQSRVKSSPLFFYSCIHSTQNTVTYFYGWWEVWLFCCFTITISTYILGVFRVPFNCS